MTTAAGPDRTALHPWIVAGLLFAGALAVRIIPFNPNLSEGSNWYWFIGAKIATGGISAIFTYDEGVFYVVLLALVELLTGPENLLAAKLVSLVASSVSVALVYLIGREVANGWCGFMAALLMMLSLLDIRFASTIQYNILYLCMLLSTVYLYTVGFRLGSRRLLAAAGVLTLLATLTRITGLILPLSLVPLYLRTRRERPEDPLVAARLRGLKTYFLLAGAGLVLFVLLSVPVFGSAAEYIRYRQINQQSMWDSIAGGDLAAIIFTIRETALNTMIALLNLDAPYSIQTSFLYRTIHFNAIAQSPWVQTATIGAVVASGAFMRFRPPYLFFVLHTAAFAAYEADLRYTLFGLAMMHLFLFVTLERIGKVVLRHRLAAAIPGTALFVFLTVARVGAYGDYLAYTNAPRFFKDKYDQLSMYGYVLADQWLVDQVEGPARVLYPVLMVDFCSVAETPGLVFDTDYTIAQDTPDLVRRIRDTAATHLVFQEIAGLEEFDEIMMRYLERVPFEEKLITSAKVHYLLSELLRDPATGRVGARTLKVGGETVHIRPIQWIVNENHFFELEERVVVFTVEQAARTPSDEIECIYDCCFQYQLP